MAKRSNKRAKRGKAAGDKLATPEEQSELAEALRRFGERVVWDDEAVAWGDVVVERNAVVIPRLSESEAPVQKLSGKEWIITALGRRHAELLALKITEAGRRLSLESQTAPDCLKLMSTGHCINELRKLNLWQPKPRGSPKQRPLK